MLQRVDIGDSLCLLTEASIGTKVLNKSKRSSLLFINKWVL